MAYFPFFTDIEGKKWLIVGGGTVSLRKVLELLPYGPLVRVVAPCMTGGLTRLESEGTYRNRLILTRREFREEDLAEADFVIAATDRKELNSHIAAVCRINRIPVNVVDVKEECSFIFPSIVRDGPVVAAISTGGASPVIATYLKERIRESLPENLGSFTRQLGGYRDRIKELFPDSSAVRSALFYELAEEGMKHNCRLSQEQAQTIINRKLEQKHE